MQRNIVHSRCHLSRSLLILALSATLSVSLPIRPLTAAEPVSPAATEKTAPAKAAPAKAAPPNVVMIIGDDQGYADYGFLGHAKIRTPNLDKLAAESLVYVRGYVPSSLCRPSLATMITGLYPHQNGITSNDPPGDRKPTDPAYIAARARMVGHFEAKPNLPKLLGAAGYLSHQSGKWWEGNACRCGGFSEAMTVGDPTRGGRHGDAGLAIGRQGLKEVTTFIDSAKTAGKPFYVWYAPMMPHQPHNPPERLLAKYRDQTDSLHVAKYWAMCEWFDETVGELLGHLDKQGLRDNTIVLYLHDNGWIQDPKAAKYAAKSKQSQYDGGLRTPILIRWPGQVKPARSEALAQSIDLAPTILTACGLKPTADMAGVNLLDSAAVAARDTIFGANFTHSAVDVDRPAANVRVRWIVSGYWKLIVPDPNNEPKAVVELYDLKADPTEEINLAAQQPERVAELRAKLDAWWKP